jgi:hypothetical protein
VPLRLKLLLVFALACALLVPPAPAALAAKGMELAIQDDFTLVNELPSVAYRQKSLTLADGLHASWVRANVNWSYVVGSAAKKKNAPKNIVYNWSGYDRLVDQAAAKGIHVQLALTGPAPAYAAGNHRMGPYKPKASAFKVFAREAAVHFAGRVTRYSIWNEPNYVSWISPLSAGPRVYRSLYTTGYAAIKKADPAASVLIAETSPYALKKRATAPLAFLRGVTCANASYHKARSCSTLKTDGYAHHPYDFDHKPTYKYPGKDNVTLGTLSRLTSALSKLKKAKLLTTPSGGVPYLYLTEYGYFASGKRKIAASKQGSYLVQAFTMAQKNPHVKQMLQYLLVQPGRKYRSFDTSIASTKAKPTAAYKKLAAWAKKAAAAGRIATASAPPPPAPPPPPPDNGGTGGSPPPPDNSPPTCTLPVPICP